MTTTRSLGSLPVAISLLVSASIFAFAGCAAAPEAAPEETTDQDIAAPDIATRDTAAGEGATRESETSDQAAASEWADRNDPDKQSVEPFRIFDNLSYIGMDWVSCYVIETSAGLILIDTLYGDFISHAVDGVRKLGLDPKDIKIVLATHGHFDHSGGIKFFKDEYGAQIGMTEADWEMSEQPPEYPAWAYPTIPRDLVLEDGDQVTLGNTTITTYVTPGHTEGVLSLDFEVHDGSDSYRAFTFGGVGLNFSGVPRTESYLSSVARIRGLNSAGGRAISVNVGNHAGVGEIFQRRDQLLTRAPGDPHPFVDPDGYSLWLDKIEAAAQEKLAQETAAAEQ